MQQTMRCRNLNNQELYRTILLEEGCDLDAPRRLRPAPSGPGNEVTLYTTDGSNWVPRLRLWFGNSFGA